MAYRLEADERVRKAVQRCAREQLQGAVRRLSEELDKDPVKAVHGARKAVKKERALLRLTRGAMPSNQRASENAALRDAARGLSAARDADVMIQTVDQLAERFAGQVPESTFSAVRDLVEEASRSERAGIVRSKLSSEVAQDLGTALVRIDDWELRHGGWRALEPGLLQTYRRGHKAFRRARRQPTLENLHEWRKRVKDLWYHLRLLEPVCGPVVRGQAKQADQLAELLGDDHDLGMLSLTLRKHHGELAVDIDALQGIVDHRRSELQTEAAYAGERLYGEKPKLFGRRIHRYWKAGRAEARAEHGHHPADLAKLTRTAHVA
jgi:CHAD domain-containing protein